jgi:hypothetical protein
LSSPSVQEPRGDTPGGPKWSLNTISTPRRAPTTTTTQAMIHSGDSLELYTALLLCATAGAFADRTRVGKALSGPVSAMLFGALAANLGVLPPPGAHYSKIQTLVVSLATPCLLFGADLRTVLRATGTLSFAFLVGSAAVALASVIAFYALSDPMHVIGLSSNGDGWKVASALVAKNIGGGMNYVAVCNTLHVTPAAFAAGIAVDNVFAVLYFPLTSWLGGAPEGLGNSLSRSNTQNASKGTGDVSTADLGRNTSTHTIDGSDGDASTGTARNGITGIGRRTDTSTPTIDGSTTTLPSDWRSVDEDDWVVENTAGTRIDVNSFPSPAQPVSISSLLLAVTVSCLVLILANQIAPESLGLLPTATAITVICATTVPQPVSKFLKPAGDTVGNALLFFFFATAGAAGGPITRYGFWAFPNPDTTFDATYGVRLRARLTSTPQYTTVQDCLLTVRKSPNTRRKGLTLFGTNPVAPSPRPCCSPI